MKLSAKQFLDSLSPTLRAEINALLRWGVGHPIKKPLRASSAKKGN